MIKVQNIFGELDKAEFNYSAPATGCTGEVVLTVRNVETWEQAQQVLAWLDLGLNVKAMVDELGKAVGALDPQLVLAALMRETANRVEAGGPAPAPAAPEPHPGKVPITKPLEQPAAAPSVPAKEPPAPAEAPAPKRSRKPKADPAPATEPEVEKAPEPEPDLPGDPEWMKADPEDDDEPTADEPAEEEAPTTSSVRATGGGVPEAIAARVMPDGATPEAYKTMRRLRTLVTSLVDDHKVTDPKIVAALCERMKADIPFLQVMEDIPGRVANTMENLAQAG